MKRSAYLIGLLFLLMGASAGFYGVRLSFFNVENDAGQNFIISWQMEEESDVREYEIHRRSIRSNGDFVKLQTIPAHGPNKTYTFKDDQVYKSASEQVDYRLEAVFNNGLRQILVSKSVNYTPTAIRRTWGSIKAMFQ